MLEPPYRGWLAALPSLTDLCICVAVWSAPLTLSPATFEPFGGTRYGYFNGHPRWGLMMTTLLLAATLVAVTALMLLDQRSWRRSQVTA